VKIFARLVSPGAANSEIWAARMDRRLDFANLDETFATDSARLQYAADAIARELLENLAPRNATPEKVPSARAGS
jgi:hypothetical protein